MANPNTKESDSGVWRSERRRNAEPVLLLLVGLDESTERLWRSVVQHDKTFALAVHQDLDAARRALEANQSPESAAILVVEASSLKKRLSFPSSVHLIAIAGPDRSGAREVGANDIVRRPLAFEELRAKVLAASDLLRRERRGTAADVLREALQGSQSGEVIVSRGAETARVHVESGKIAWVHRSDHVVSMRTLLANHGVDVDEVTSREVVDEGRRTRRHFGDVLVARGIVTAEVLRECIRRHLARELDAIFAWTDATATIVSDNRSLGSPFAFGASELTIPGRHRARVHTQPGMPAIVPERAAVPQRTVDGWLDRIEEVADVIGCAVLDPKSGVVLGSRGFVDATLQIAWSMVATFVALGDEREEVIATTKSLAFLVRSVEPALPGVAVLCFDPTKLSQGMARILFSKIVADSIPPGS